MDVVIPFNFEGVRYLAGLDFYHLGYWQLPDGRTVCAGGWWGGLVPVPFNVVIKEDADAGTVLRV